jgi:sortase A
MKDRRKRIGLILIIFGDVLLLGVVLAFIFLYPKSTSPAPKPKANVSPTLQDAPQKPKEVIQLDRIIIPKLDLSERVYEGVDRETLNKGPGHYPGTANSAGAEGNVVLAGHSARTREHPDFFGRLDELDIGDQIVLLNKDGNGKTYKVTEKKIVAATDLSVLNPTAKPSVTLITCIKPNYPRDKRLIIIAQLKD